MLSVVLSLCRWSGISISLDLDVEVEESYYIAIFPLPLRATWQGEWEVSKNYEYLQYEEREYHYCSTVYTSDIPKCRIEGNNSS
jgi:hypothetical protein